MIGDVAAAVDLVEGDAAPRQQLVRRENVRSLGIAAEGEHRWMLEEQEYVSDAARRAQRDQLVLKAKGVAVVHAAEIEVPDHPLMRL